MKKSLIYMAAAMTAFTLPLTSCQNEDEPGMSKGREVHLTVTAARDAMTRTSMEVDDEANLVCKWSAGDQLVVFANRKNAGVLTIRQGEEGKVRSVFEGTVNLPEGAEEIVLSYLGSGYEGNLAELSGKVMIDLSEQDGSFASLTEKDVLGESAFVEVLGNSATANVEMRRILASGYFNLALPDGIELGEGDVVTISSDENSMWNRFQYIPASVGTSVVDDYLGAITITKAEAGNDIYLTMKSCTTSLTFQVSKGGYIYTAKLGSHTWEEATYVRNDDGSAVKVTDWTKEKIAANPGDMGNWSGAEDNTNPVASTFSPVFASRLDGWVLNAGNSYDVYGGWCYAVDITNGLHNGLLTSKANTCFYYQWGRYLGFPSSVAGVSTTFLGAESVNIFVGYLGDNGAGTPVKYTAAYMGNSSAYNVQKSKDWAICFGQTNNNYLDYIYGNANNTDWYDRSDNPCPDGYRIPTYAELSVFIPSTMEVNGSYAEVKTINGKKYAMKWVVGSSSSVSYVDVYSVETTEASVSVSSSIFNGVSPKRIWAYGYLMNDGKQSSWGSTAAYWSSDSGTNNALDDVSGKGGRALYIEFSGSTAVFAELNIPFGFGLPVMPIKDADAKASKCRPWLPYSWDMTQLPGYK